jgi:hypothetical protein
MQDQLQGRPVYWNVINQPAHLNLKDFKDVSPGALGDPNTYINAYYPNPWWQIYNSRSKTNSKDLVTSLELNYKFLDWLNVTVRSGISQTKAEAPAFVNAIDYAPYAVNDPWGGGNIASSYVQRDYQYEIINAKYSDWNSDAFLTIKKKWNKYSLNFIAGGNFRKRDTDGDWYYNEAYGRIGGVKRVDDPRGGGFLPFAYKRRDFGAYGDVTLGYDDWVFLHGSFRNDWLSVLDQDNRTFNYPSADIALVLHEKIEALKNSATISFLKVRAGYAVTGNVSLGSRAGFGALGGLIVPSYGAYNIYPTVGNGAGFPYNSLDGFTQSNLKVQDGLRPEKNRSFEAGFELGLFRDRIRLEAVAYRQSAIDQTVQLATATSSGTTALLANSGEILNRGLEFDLKLTPFIRLGKFKWNLNVNAAILDNKIKSINSSLGLNEIQLAGSPNGFFGGGIFAIAGQDYPSIKTTDFKRDPQGRIIVDAASGLPTVDPVLKVFGNTNYKHRLGITSQMNFGGISLNVVAEYRGGAKIWNAVGADMDFTGVSGNSAQNRQRFVIPNSVYDDGTGKLVPNTDITIPDGGIGWWASFYNRIGAPYVNSAAFWKLREVNLGYDLPAKWLGGGKVIKRVNVALIGRNLLMLRPATNIWTDPEFSDSGIGNAVGTTSVNQTPPTRIFGFSINVTL